MTSPQKSEMSYRRDIDGLRALAVLGTIAFHCYPGIFTNGYIGVDVFFVISGFLITSIILNKSLKNKFSILNFYSRRIKRILPPALLVLGAVTFVGIFTLFANEWRSLQSYIAPAAGFYVNFKLLEDTFYFSVMSQYKPLLHYWSLAVEEQFYLLWPLVFSFLYKFLGKTPADSVNLARRLSLGIFVLLIPSLTYFLISTDDLYFSSAARIWELMMGSMAATFYYLLNNSEEAYKQYLKYSDAMSIGGFSLLAISQLAERKYAITLGVIAAFFLVISPENSRGKGFLKLNSMNYLGLMSFSLYLWHWPVLSFYHMYKPEVSNLETFSLIILIFALSTLSYLFVEKPLKNQSWDLVSGTGKYNLKNIFPIAGCLFVSLYFYSANFIKIPDLFTNEFSYADENDLPIHKSKVVTSLETEEKIERWVFSENIVKADQGLLLGDSQAAELYLGMVTESQSVSWHLVSAEACSPYPIPTMYEFCRNIIDDSLKNLESHPEIQYIVFAMANHKFLENRETFLDPEVKKQIVTKLQKLVSLNKKIVLSRPTPEFPKSVNSCSRQRFSFYKVFDNSKYCKLDKKWWVQFSSEFNGFIDSLKAEVPEIVIIDGTDIVCDDSECHAARDGKALYFDMSHLSYEGNRQLSRKILNSVK